MSRKRQSCSCLVLYFRASTHQWKWLNLQVSFHRREMKSLEQNMFQGSSVYLSSQELMCYLSLVATSTELWAGLNRGNVDAQNWRRAHEFLWWVHWRAWEWAFQSRSLPENLSDPLSQKPLMMALRANDKQAVWRVSMASVTMAPKSLVWQNLVQNTGYLHAPLAHALIGLRLATSLWSPHAHQSISIASLSVEPGLMTHLCPSTSHRVWGIDPAVHKFSSIDLEPHHVTDLCPRCSPFSHLVSPLSLLRHDLTLFTFEEMTFLYIMVPFVIVWTSIAYRLFFFFSEKHRYNSWCSN